MPSLTVAAVDVLRTLFRAPLTLGVHPGDRNIAYDLALVKLGPHTKFGEDWSNDLAVHWIHTDRQTTLQIYIRRCLYAECHYAECNYTECHYAECR